VGASIWHQSTWGGLALDSTTVYNQVSRSHACDGCLLWCQEA
jgi:hypothetical protein